MIINNFTKMLIGAAVGTAVVAGVGVFIVSKEKEEKHDVAEQAVVQDEDGSVLKKIKRFVKKKVIKFLAFVALHMEQIEAISTCVGLVTGVIGIASAIKEYKRGDDLQKQIDDLHKEIVNQTNALGLYVEDCTKVLNSNLKTTDEDIIKFAKAMKIDLLAPNEVVA